MSDLSARKFSRKVDADGVKPAIIDAIELIARKYASKPAFNILTSVGILTLVSRDDLIGRASNVSQSFNSAGGGQNRFAASLEGGYLLPTTGLSFTEDWEIISESVSNPDLSNLFVREAIVRHDRLSDVNISTELVGLSHIPSKHIKDAGTIAPLSPRYYNYYHWMVQTLPRLRYLRDYERQTDEEVTIILPPENPPWMEETIEMIGWPERKIERGTHSVYHASKLVIPSYPPVHEQELRWLREQLLPHADDLDQDSGPNIFISRSNAIERRIV
ncbi:glycosyltransferase family 61 protein, partial [Halolamina salifodinae]